MTSTLEIARDALMLTLIVILIYVLYKRMLVFMNKKAEKGVYVEIVRFEVLHQHQLEFDLSVPETSNLEFSIANDQGAEVTAPTKRSFDEGTHTVRLPITDLTSGKYCLTLQSANAKKTRFFHIS